MTWIATVPPDAAQDELGALYDRLKGPDGHVDNILIAHSLRPHTLTGHMALYKSVLHHRANALPRWLLESIGVAVSRANRCDYCIDHHRAGLRRALGNDEHFARIDAALVTGELEGAFDDRDASLIRYAIRLTERPSTLTADDIDAMRRAGAADGEILEVNQVAGYFAYANRTVLGLGVVTAGEPLGPSPSHDADDDWRHR